MVATRVRLNEFNHDELACDVARDFRVAYRDVEALYGRAAMRRVPIFGVGHSLGAKVHMLLNCYPEVVDVAKRRKVRREGGGLVAERPLVRACCPHRRWEIGGCWGVLVSLTLQSGGEGDEQPLRLGFGRREESWTAVLRGSGTPFHGALVGVPCGAVRRVCVRCRRVR